MEQIADERRRHLIWRITCLAQSDKCVRRHRAATRHPLSFANRFELRTKVVDRPVNLLLENGRLDSKAPLRSDRHIEDRQRLVVATETLSFFEVTRCASSMRRSPLAIASRSDFGWDSARANASRNENINTATDFFIGLPDSFGGADGEINPNRVVHRVETELFAVVDQQIARAVFRQRRNGLPGNFFQ